MADVTREELVTVEMSPEEFDILVDAMENIVDPDAGQVALLEDLKAG